MSNDVTKEDTLETKPSVLAESGGGGGGDDEFFDADDDDDGIIEKLKLDDYSNLPQTDIKNTEEPIESKFVPLHEELNKKLKDPASDEDDEQEVIDDDDSARPDPFFVDEEKLKSQDESMSDEEKQKNLEDAMKLKQQGNESFKAENFHEALELYTKALHTCPYSFTKERAVFYSNRAICFFKMKDNDRCIKECTSSIQLDDSFTKPLMRRADCLEITDKLDEALLDYKKLAELEPAVLSHKRKCFELEEKIKERNEKLKTEMMGKLKDLGNMVLKPFGLSTNNFEFVQDPNTGSYSVNFKK